MYFLEGFLTQGERSVSVAVFGQGPMQLLVVRFALMDTEVEALSLTSPTCQVPVTPSPGTATATGHRCEFRRWSDQRVITSPLRQVY